VPPPCRATFGTSRLPSLPLSRRRVLFAAVQTGTCGIRSNRQAWCTQSGGGINRRPWMLVERLFRTLSACRPVVGGWTPCHTFRGLCISTLHVSLKIRCCRALNPQRVAFFASSVTSWRHNISKAGISEAFARNARKRRWRAEVLRKESGKQVKHRTCRFFSVFSTRRWWRFQAFIKLASAP
jgi:hypothetical protein